MMILSPSDTLTKTCKTCGRRKPLTDFHRNPTTADRHLNHCKECVRIYRMANIEKDREQKRAYYETEHGKIVRSINRKIYQQRYPERYAAHIVVSNAIRDGRLIRNVCETCGTAKVQAHHDNYNRPLEVRWFCCSCHVAHHKAEREASR